MIRRPPRSTLFPSTTLSRSLWSPHTVSRDEPLFPPPHVDVPARDRKSTRLNSSHSQISYAVFCLKKKKSCDARSHSLRRVLMHCRQPDASALSAHSPQLRYP